jgi:hypothetical protein
MISSILSYCTIDFKFLEVNLKQLSKFSDEIIVPICSHLFNGEPENPVLLQKSIEIIKKYQKCKYVIFDWEGKKENISYYHTLSRKIGTEISQYDWLFFVDADEIASDEFKDWFLSICDTDYTLWITSYWYFREPIYRSKSYEAQGLLIKRKLCNWNCNHIREREQLFENLNNFIHGGFNLILDQNKKPLLHHFSWVRTKEEMIKKVQNWGHNNDRNWIELIEKEFSHPFNGTDFINNYKYDIVKNIFNLPLSEKPLFLYQ